MPQVLQDPLQRSQSTRIAQIVPSDLDTLALDYLILLHAADTWPNGGLYEGVYLQEAIRRYISLWLPFLNSLDQHGRATTLPPLDIAYVWHIHRLHPDHYASYCYTHLGRFISPSHRQAFHFTTDAPPAWHQHFPNEPFYPPHLRSKPHPAPHKQTHSPTHPTPHATEPTPTPSAPPSTPPSAPHTPPPSTPPPLTPPLPQSSLTPSKVHQFLNEATARQAPFCCLLLRSCYQDPRFRHQARMRYCRFLQLSQSNPEVPLVPTMDIDLMWRTHLLLSGTYQDDCMSLLGKVLLHPLPVDLTQVAHTLSPAYSITKSLYEAAFPHEHYEATHELYPPKAAPKPVMDILTYSARFLGEPSVRRVGVHMLYTHWTLLGDFRGHAIREGWKPGQPLNPEENGKLWEQTLQAWLKRMGRQTAFEKLPHGSDHEYWQWFRKGSSKGGIFVTVVGGSEPGEEGFEVRCMGWALERLDDGLGRSSQLVEHKCGICGEVLTSTVAGRNGHRCSR